MRSGSSSAVISTQRPPASRERTRSSSASRSPGGRSAATTTWRPASSSALSAWPNSFWNRLALQELHVVDDQQIDRPHRLLESDRGVRLQRGDEAVHEAFGGQIDDAAPLRRRGVRGRLEQMGLAEADRRMDIERAEGRRLSGAVFDDALRRGIGELIGAADQERSERQADDRAANWRALPRTRRPPRATRRRAAPSRKRRAPSAGAQRRSPWAGWEQRRRRSGATDAPIDERSPIAIDATPPISASSAARMRSL